MLELGQTLDRYTVVDELGRGGMAVVYRVRHTTLGSEHALKILTIHGASIRERLVLEGRVQAGLRHPNIVAVTDVIDVDGSPGLVMEYVAGPSLEQWLHHNKPDLATAERLFRGVLAGVRRAHRVGLVHRDLKPGNVLLETTEEGVIPKVADFGLAKALESGGGMNRTRTGIAMGTPAYMAPEQIRDAKNVDERADIFSLGCILYELVVGQAPFEGPDVLSIFNSVCEGRYVSVTERVPVSPHLEEAIQGCLQVDREQRIPHCDALLEVLGGGPWSPSLAASVTAPPPPTLHPGGQSMGSVGGGSSGPVPMPPPESRETLALHGPAGVSSQVSLLPDIAPGASLVPRAAPAPAPEDAHPPEPPPRRRKGLWLGLGGTALALGVIGLMSLGDRSGEGSASPSVALAPAPLSAPEPVASAPDLRTEVTAEPEPKRSTRGEPKPARVPRTAPVTRSPSPEAAPAETRPEPAAAPSAEPAPGSDAEDPESRPRLVDQLRLAVKSTYTVRGDALAVWLVGPDGSKHSAGAQIPAGNYTIKARFQSWDGVVDAGVVQILPGSAVTITCKEALLSCTK